jgi:hypothetical protein
MKGLAAAIALALAPSGAMTVTPPDAIGDGAFTPADGPVTIANSPVRKGQTVVTISVQPAHTGVLVGDAKSGQRLILPDGSPVFRGGFQQTLNAMRLSSGTVWCGVPPGAAKGWCLLDVGNGLDVLVGMSTLFNPTPYSLDAYSTIDGRINKPLPIVREQPVTFPTRLRAEISFQGWERGAARFKAWISDDAGRRSFWTWFDAPPEADGSVVLALYEGGLRLRRSGDGATLEQVPAAGAPAAHAAQPAPTTVP